MKLKILQLLMLALGFIAINLNAKNRIIFDYKELKNQLTNYFLFMNTSLPEVMSSVSEQIIYDLTLNEPKMKGSY